MRRRLLFVLIGGWGPRGFTGYLAKALERRRREPLIIKPVRRDGGPSPDPNLIRFPWAMLRLANSVNAQLEGQSQPRVVIAHSMGFIAALIAALSNPDQLPLAIVGINPAGFLRDDDFRSLRRRSGRKTTHSIRLAFKDRSLFRPTLVSLWWNFLYLVVNRRRALEEARCLPTCVADEWIAALQALGVKVYAVFGDDDLIYPEADCRSLAARLDGYEVLPRTQHDSWYRTDPLLLAIGRLLGPEPFALEGNDA